jgi:cyclophilin family peptidyl-prolyl cis-trans isomerase
MSTGRTPKRARKKEQRDVRREALRQAAQRRRRQRLILLASSLALIGGGVLIVLFLQDEPGKALKPTPSGDASALRAPRPRPVACGAKLPTTAGSRKRSYTQAKNQDLDPDKTYILRLETSCGDIEIKLDVEESPSTSNSVAFLASEHFYDGLVFHRVVPGFVIQGGDPRGTGVGDAGYDIVEPPPDDFKYVEGAVAMAKGGTDPPGSSSSQFFIVSGPEAADLPAEYAVVGKVVDGMDVVEKIEKLGRQGQDSPKAWAYIERARVIAE